MHEDHKANGIAVFVEVSILFQLNEKATLHRQGDGALDLTKQGSNATPTR